MKNKQRFLFGLVCTFCVVALFSAPTLLAQEPVTDDEVNEIASQLFCPTCEAIPVDDCPTQVCADWRAEIRSQLSEGRSEAEILADFERRFGSGVLATPPARGFGLFVYVVPILVALGGIFIFYRQMNQLIGAAEEAPDVKSVAETNSKTEKVKKEQLSYRDRIEAELGNDVS